MVATSTNTTATRTAKAVRTTLAEPSEGASSAGTDASSTGGCGAISTCGRWSASTGDSGASSADAFSAAPQVVQKASSPVRSMPQTGHFMVVRLPAGILARREFRFAVRMIA
jgi:hypothetical protein